MRFGVFGTGVVGQNIGKKLIELGHEVTLGSRTKNNENATKWVQANGSRSHSGTFLQAAKFGEILFNCTLGAASLEVLRLAGPENISGKILVDISNPLDFSKGMPPTLSICNEDSLGERIQRTFPDVKVVKTLNTLTSEVQINPSLVPGEHSVFISGNDEKAKSKVVSILQSFGWKSIIDLGDISTCRGTEMLLPLWLRLWNAFQTPYFNFHIVKK